MRQLIDPNGEKSLFVESIILENDGHKLLTDAIVDTGATKTIIDKSVAYSLHIDPEIRFGNYTEIQTADGVLKGAKKEIDAIVIGTDRIEYPSVVVVDFSADVRKALHNITVVLGADYIGAAGILG